MLSALILSPADCHLCFCFSFSCHSLLHRNNLRTQLFASFQRQGTNISQYISWFWMPQRIFDRLQQHKTLLFLLMHLIDNGFSRTFSPLQAQSASAVRAYFPQWVWLLQGWDYTCFRECVCFRTICAFSVHCNSVDSVWFLCGQFAPRSYRDIWAQKTWGVIVYTPGSET